MSAPWENLLKISTGFMEAGLMAVHAGARSLQDTLETLTGPKSNGWQKSPPFEGPPNVDFALSDLANQLVKIGRRTPAEGAEIVKAIGEALQYARQSFGYLDPRDPSILTLPLTLPLSAAGIMSETMLRGIMGYSVLGPRKLSHSWVTSWNSYCEVGVYVSLQYKGLIDRHQERLKRDPDDYATRAELGRVYVKCGLYDQAVRELSLAAQDPATRALAMHETAVAHYRAGRFEQAVTAAVDAMEARPDNERTRAWLWLASRSLGGYPESVPVKHRMEMKVGYAPPRVKFENIAAQNRLGQNQRRPRHGDLRLQQRRAARHRHHGGARGMPASTATTATEPSPTSRSNPASISAVNGFSIIAGDYDNDGFVDLYVTRLGFYVGDGTLLSQQRRRHLHRRHDKGRRAELGALLYRVVGGLRLRRIPRPVHRQ